MLRGDGELEKILKTPSSILSIVWYSLRTPQYSSTEKSMVTDELRLLSRTQKRRRPESRGPEIRNIEKSRTKAVLPHRDPVQAMHGLVRSCWRGKFPRGNRGVLPGRARGRPIRRQMSNGRVECGSCILICTSMNIHT